MNGRKRFQLEWTVGPSGAVNELPEETVPARVPGAVQTDWARAKNWPAPEYDLECEARYQWMENHHWHYQAQCRVPELEPGGTAAFLCGGVDYACSVFLQDELVLEQEGMQIPLEVDLTPHAGEEITLRVVVHPVPKSRGEEVEDFRSNADRSAKPAFNYGWDFHPRLISQGIWRETCLETRPATLLRQCETRYELADDLRSARLWLETVASRPGRIIWRLLDPRGAQVIEQTREITEDQAETPCRLDASLADPQLWWPHDQGRPLLYRSLVQWVSPDNDIVEEHAQNIGFRRVRLVMNEGAWDIPNPKEFPKTRSEAPMQFEVNGRRIFIRGTNLVSPDTFAGRVTRDTWQPILDRVTEANLNFLRMWGGSPAQDDGFFDECDRRGMLVWQEFPLSCNNYEDDPHYLSVLDADSRALIQRLRRHPSLALWCGGNELYNAWSGMTDQHKALRLLNRNCYDLDPDRPFLPTSPLMGCVHGYYKFLTPQGHDVFQYTQANRPTCFMEIGVPGTAPLAVLREHMPEAELVIKAGHKHPQENRRFWDSQRISWFGPREMNEIFGGFENLEDYVQKTDWLQKEGLKAVYEEARRQKPRCSAVANWCFNEPTLNFANSCVLAWPAEPKAGYYGIKEACRPVLASARVPRFQWGIETFQAELWLLNDTFQQHAPVKVSAEIEIGDQTLPGLVWTTPAVGPNQNAQGPVLQIQLPSVPVTEFFLVLRVSDRPEWNSRYRLRFHDDPDWQFQPNPSFSGGLDLTEGHTVLGEASD